VLLTGIPHSEIHIYPQSATNLVRTHVTSSVATQQGPSSILRPRSARFFNTPTILCHAVTAHMLELESQWTTFGGVICRGDHHQPICQLMSRVLQVCVEIFRWVSFNSRYVGLNQPPILASIAYLDTSANIRELGAWTIHLMRCTWRFLNHNKELALKISIRTADMSSGLFPGTP